MVHTIDVVICALQFRPLIQEVMASGYHTWPRPSDAIGCPTHKTFDRVPPETMSETTNIGSN